MLFRSEIAKLPDAQKAPALQAWADHFVAKIRAGKVLFELDGIAKTAAEEAMRLAAHKLSIKTKFIVKQ